MRLTLRRALLAKIETTYGTDPVPTGAANAMYVQNLSITPMELATAERNPVRPFFGPDTTIIGGTPVKCEFEVNLAGSGDVGITAPAYGPLLRACALSQTINAAVDVTYALVSSAFESVTIYVNEDGVLHKMTGCYGSFSLEFNHEGIPVAKYNFLGLYNVPTDTALPTLTLTAFQKPLPMNKVNTTPVTLHGISVILSKFSLKVENGLSWKDYVNVGAQEVRLTSRKITGSLSIQADTVAIKDWWTTVKAGTTGAFTMTHGTVAGNKTKLDAATVQLMNPAYEDDGGVRSLKMDFMLYPSGAGNDEFIYKTL